MSDDDCSLNGICTDKTCVCDPGWLGADCGQLDVRPGPRANGYNRTGEGTSSWCNDIIHDPVNPAVFHSFVSEFTHGCGLDYWSPYSRIIRAESTSGPMGPYEYKQEIVPTFSHNPSVVWSEAEKRYLLYNIGCNITLPAIGCTNMNFSCGAGNVLHGESGISVWSSPDLRHWKPHGQVFRGANNCSWDADVTNPSPFILHSHPHESSSSILLAYRSCPFNCYEGEVINIAKASHLSGPYAKISSMKPIFPEASEDPFIWRDKRGNFHMLVHSVLSDAGFGDGPNVGRHAYARSWDGKWNFNLRSVAFNTTVDFADGSTINYYRRERPTIFFSEEGLMTPLYLSTGVQEVDSSQSYSLIQPVGDRAVVYEKSIGF